MQIKELFIKPVDREIDGVIKASDDRKLAVELEEYVITSEVKKGLETFTDRYLTEKSVNGVWISGFFGSGKSHLLKILSLMLDGKVVIEGKRPSDYIIPKVEDELLKAQLRKACAIPSRSILFNIDEKFDGIGGEKAAPILDVFIKVMNELQGYFPKQGYIAQFEHQLDMKGALEDFKKTYQEENGSTWESDRESITTVKRKAFGKACTKAFGQNESEAAAMIDNLRREYRVSIESLAERVKAYIDKQPPGFRLNFFVDEVGQFVGNDASRMLNLQTVAESLGSKCNGQAWVFVTSQASLEGLIGNFRDSNAEQISKIQGRFKTKLTLASSDVKEVIQMRLLAKKEDEPEALTVIYDAEKDNMKTLFTFGDQSAEYPTWRGSDEFCKLYPFHNYQFELFQLALKELSIHEAFTGKFHSVGERSMLTVFQDVAKVVMADEVGRLATFDQMYDGVKPTIRAELHQMIDAAVRLFGNGMEARILKALFLLKWVAQFKATKRNIAVLLIDNPKVNIGLHVAAVEAALARLEAQSFVQRNGEHYEYLTNVEIDIEKEIKNTNVPDQEVAKYLSDVFVTDILGSPKIRYNQNGQDFAFGKKINGSPVDGTDGGGICINVVTSEHPSVANQAAIIMQNSATTDLMINASGATRLVELARAYLRTKRYTATNMGTGDTNKADAIRIRQRQNGDRAGQIKDQAKEILGKCDLYVGGNKLSIGTSEAKARIISAAQDLITHTYQKLRMVPGQHDETSLRKTLLDRDDLLAGGATPLSPAEEEVLSYSNRRILDGARLSASDLVEHFSRTPFGWGKFATLSQLARLMRMGKIELRSQQALLDCRQAAEDLSSNSKIGNVIIQLQATYDITKVNALKKFHQDFFGKANPGNDPRTIALAVSDALRAEHTELSAMLKQSEAYYPFLSELKPAVKLIGETAERDASFLINNLTEYGESLLGMKEDLINPIKAFMNGTQRATYDSVTDFFKKQEVNIAELSAGQQEPIKALISSRTPYLGLVLRDAKAARDAAQSRIEELLANARANAVRVIDSLETGLKSVPEFSKLNESQKQEVFGMSADIRLKLQGESFIPAAQQHVQTYKDRTYSLQLDRITQLATPPQDPIPGGKLPVPPPQLPTYVGFREMMQGKDQALINDQAGLEAWIQDFRERASAELAKGKRIRLS
jgi:hypothetical protein